MTPKQKVFNFKYQHKETFPKEYYNKPFKSIHRGVEKYRFLKKTDPKTFEYGCLCTTVDIIPYYKDREGKEFTRVYMSTIDDASMSIWLKVQDKKVIYNIIKFFQNKKRLKSCDQTYRDMSFVFGWPLPEEFYSTFNNSNSEVIFLYFN